MAPLFAVAQAQEPAAITVKVGGKKALVVADVSRVAVGDPAVADIRVGGAEQLEVTGRSAGTTQLHVWKSDGKKVSYQVTVTR